MISIIIPVYNAAPYIERCVESVLTQGVSDMELIAVNDGSTDNSLALLRRLAEGDARMRVVDKPNGGVSSARNMGIDLAKGDMLMFVDADDYLLPSSLAAAIDEARLHDADLCVFGMRRIARNAPTPRECINVNRLYTGVEVTEYMERDALSLGSPWAKIYRTSTIKDNNIYFNEEQKKCEDLTFALLYLQFCKTVWTSPLVVYCYEVNFESATARFHGQQFIDDTRHLLDDATATEKWMTEHYGDSEHLRQFKRMYEETCVFECLFQVYNLYRQPVAGRLHWLRRLMDEMHAFSPDCSKMFTTAVPRAVYKAYSIHPLLAHTLLTCIFKTESIYRKIKK